MLLSQTDQELYGKLGKARWINLSVQLTDAKLKSQLYDTVALKYMKAQERLDWALPEIKRKEGVIQDKDRAISRLVDEKEVFRKRSDSLALIIIDMRLNAITPKRSIWRRSSQEK